MTNHRPSPMRMVGYTAGQKVVTIVAVVAVALGGLLFAVWAVRPADAPQAGGPANQIPSAAPPQTAGMNAAVTGVDERTVAYENRLNASLQKMLDSVVGPGHSAVTTTAELDLDEVATTARTYTSDPTVAVLAESISREAYRGTGARTAGVLGPRTIAEPGAAEGNWYDNSRVVRSNAVNQVTETRRRAPGAVKRLTVAVLLDATTAAAVEPAQLQQLVSAAAGLDAARGDAVAVAAMPFDTSIADQARQALAESNAAANTAKQEALIKTVVLAMIVLLLTFMAWQAVRRAKMRTVFSPAVQARLHAMQVAAEQQRLSQLNSSIPQSAAQAEVSRTVNPRQQRALERMIEEKPDEIAALVRSWSGPVVDDRQGNR